MTKVTQGFIDRSGERSHTLYYVEAGVLDDYTDALAAANAVKGGMAVVTLCNFTDQNLVILADGDIPTIPTSPNAQRELALWVQYTDAVNGDYGTFTVPGPNLTLLGQANTDEVDIVSNVTMAAFVVILEANLVSVDLNAIEITRARIIGRRS